MGKLGGTREMGSALALARKPLCSDLGYLMDGCVHENKPVLLLCPWGQSGKTWYTSERSVLLGQCSNRLLRVDPQQPPCQTTPWPLW